MPAPSHRRRRVEKPAGALLATLVLAAVAVPAASGHAIVRPGASRPADLQQYTVTIPTEREVPTVEVDLKVPEGIGFLLVQEVPGWESEVVRKDDRVDEIRWTGGSIPPDHFAAFRFIARNPVLEGEIAWPIVQRYEGGEAVRWIGGADSETPAARTTITESATPVDVVDIVGGTDPTPTAGTGDTGSQESSSSGDRDELTLVIAIAAAIAALAALGLAVTGRRRGGNAAV